MSTIPKGFTLNSLPWSVEEKTGGEMFEERGGNLLGYVSYSENRVCVLEELTPARKASILLHEIVHALAEENGITLSEQDTRNFSGDFFSLIRTNPELVQYFMEPE